MKLQGRFSCAYLATKNWVFLLARKLPVSVLCQGGLALLHGLQGPDADPGSLRSDNLNDVQKGLPAGAQGWNPIRYGSSRKNAAVCPSGHLAPFFRFQLWNASKQQVQRADSEMLDANEVGMLFPWDAYLVQRTQSKMAASVLNHR